MTITYEEINPSLIENTTMKKCLFDGVHRTYTINANEGYILHDVNYDTVIYDDETGEPTGEVVLGFRPPESTATCSATYDFAANPRGFYAIPAAELPEGAEIYGGVTPDTETM